MTNAEIIQITTGLIGTFGFSVLFNIRGKRLALSTLGGFLSWFLFIILNRITGIEPLAYFLVAALISVYAEVMARLEKTPTTTFITPSLIPLIPGGSLYYTMAYALDSDVERFTEKAIYTLELASALALGIIVATAFAKLITKASH